MKYSRLEGLETIEVSRSPGGCSLSSAVGPGVCTQASVPPLPALALHLELPGAPVGPYVAGGGALPSGLWGHWSESAFVPCPPCSGEGRTPVVHGEHLEEWVLVLWVPRPPMSDLLPKVPGCL